MLKDVVVTDEVRNDGLRGEVANALDFDTKQKRANNVLVNWIIFAIRNGRSYGLFL
jgi:hypothetical protein